jgi:hypothetical protein
VNAGNSSSQRPSPASGLILLAVGVIFMMRQPSNAANLIMLAVIGVVLVLLVRWGEARTSVIDRLASRPPERFQPPRTPLPRGSATSEVPHTPRYPRLQE